MTNKAALPEQPPDEVQLPLLSEQATVSKARVVDSHISIERTTSSSQQLLETELLREEVNIEVIPVNKPVEDDYSDQPHYVGEVLIIPVIEERIEIIRRKVLKEEIHVHKVQKVEPFQQSVTVRSQEVEIRQEKGKP